MTIPKEKSDNLSNFCNSNTMTSLLNAKSGSPKPKDKNVSWSLKSMIFNKKSKTCNPNLTSKGLSSTRRLNPWESSVMICSRLSRKRRKSSSWLKTSSRIYKMAIPPELMNSRPTLKNWRKTSKPESEKTPSHDKGKDKATVFPKTANFSMPTVKLTLTASLLIRTHADKKDTLEATFLTRASKKQIHKW